MVLLRTWVLTQSFTAVFRVSLLWGVTPVGQKTENTVKKTLAFSQHVLVQVIRNIPKAEELYKKKKAVAIF